MVRIAVLISGSGTNLQALIDATKKKYIDGEIVLVVSNRLKAFGLQRASNANIKAECIKDEKLLIEKLKEEKVDLIVLAGYLAIISEELINLYENKIINIHPSLIPSFAGPGFYGIHVQEAVYKRGVNVSGATVHFVSKEVDGGPIILQKSIDISSCKSPEEIQDKILLNIEHDLLVEAVKLYCENKLKVINERVEII
ncbi:MAG: phosphoribosylglycinamide formyltransferase [Bacilli bacterium]|nr:phosphoribosylglycinamide formyltransferase [Bacilli bacterium]